jgi:hypothetical protein
MRFFSSIEDWWKRLWVDIINRPPRAFFYIWKFKTLFDAFSFELRRLRENHVYAKNSFSRDALNVITINCSDPATCRSRIDFACNQHNCFTIISDLFDIQQSIWLDLEYFNRAISFSKSQILQKSQFFVKNVSYAIISVSSSVLYMDHYRVHLSSTKNHYFNIIPS